MERRRKIKPVVKKLSFAEAEEQDDLFWAEASVERRLEELFSLRKMLFENRGENISSGRIAKVVNKVSLYEQGD